MFDEQFWLQVISGERRGFASGLLRCLLWLLTPPYRLIIQLRNLAYDNGWKQSVTAPLRIISIGNLTTGGTGKSPLVIWLAEQLRARGRRVCVLSRGYKGSAAGENDESLELADRLPDVPQLVNPDRAASAHIASEELEMEAGLLDDGFQHRQLRRDLDLVLSARNWSDFAQPIGLPSARWCQGSCDKRTGGTSLWTSWPGKNCLLFADWATRRPFFERQSRLASRWSARRPSPIITLTRPMT